MSRITVSRLDQDISIRVPFDLIRSTGISDGDSVEVRTAGNAIVIERITENERADAILAAEEIIAESSRYAMSDQEIRELIEEGRRG